MMSCHYDFYGAKDLPRRMNFVLHLYLGIFCPSVIRNEKLTLSTPTVPVDGA